MLSSDATPSFYHLKHQFMVYALSLCKSVWSEYTQVFCTVLADAGTRRPSNAERRAVADLRLGDGTLHW